MGDAYGQADMLSSERQELLELWLKKKGINVPRASLIPRRAEAGPCPLSFAQERLWFLHRLEPHSPAYNIPTAARLVGPLNRAALEQSLYEIVRRHEVLRTIFLELKGQPVQVISPAQPPTIPVVDLRAWPEVAREAQARQVATEEAQRPFDLAEGPLLRVRLLYLGEQEHIALFTMHHIVSDGWSQGVLMREVALLYAAFSAGRHSPLPELPIQYADFAQWQRQWLEGEVMGAQLSYWRQRLAGPLPLLSLPTDHPRPPIPSFRGATRSLGLPRGLGEAVKALSQREGVTLFVTLLAAFKVLLFRYTGQKDIVVGTPIAGRNRVELEGLIGFFVNTLVMRTDLTGDPSFHALLGQVREAALGAYAHQDLPFEKLVEDLRPGRRLSHTPLFQVMFVFQNTPTPALELPGLQVMAVGSDTGTAKFDLTLSMAEGPQGLTATMTYSSDLFDLPTIGRMLRQFQTLLESIVAGPDQPLSRLRLASEAERRQILIDFNSD